MLNARAENGDSQPDHIAANLSQALLDHADLAGINLAKANLCGATLRFATLSAADLEAADLSHADLQLALCNRANFGAAILSGAVLDHTNFTAANLTKAKLCGAILRFATLTAAKFDGADLSSADLRHARLDRADFRAANLSGAELDYADFSGANLADADLSGANLRYAKNLAKAQLDECRLSATTIPPLYFEYSQCRPMRNGRSRAAGGWPFGIAGAMVGALASLGLIWQFVGAGDAMTVQAEANAVAGQVAAAPKFVSLSARTTAPDNRVEASNASLIAATPTEFSPLRPVVRTLSFAVATSDALPITATPALTARHAGAPNTLTSLPPENTVPGTKVALYRVVLSTRQPPVLSDIPPLFLNAVTTIQSVAVRELGAQELARESTGVTGEPLFASFAGFEPLTLVVSLREQKIDVYRGTSLVTSSKVSSGRRGHDTKAGVFSILEKRRHHHSNLYSGAPMPWMQRLTWTGTALHGGVVPGYPASHGCIRLPFSFAPKLFQMTTLGANVVVAGDRVAPKPIKHANLFQPVPEPVEVSLAAAEPNLFTPGFSSTAAASERPERAETTVEVAADKPAGAPLRILVTRRTNLDQVISTQYLLAALGYLTPQKFSGRLGQETLAAIKEFQKANRLPETGAFSDELAKKVRQVAGKAEPPPGHLFVRQDFRPVLDAPITFREPKQSLGTHVFTVGLAPGSAEAAWTAISLEGGESASVLDRIEIPADVRKIISQRLTPGSTLIVADTGVNSAILPDGDDFLVLAKTTPTIAALEPQQDAKQRTATAKRAKAGTAVVKPRIQGTRKRAARRSYPPDLYGGFRLFRRW
jgi:peptidoglycan hydrolase-like protein with peptidoglycan-binding domain